MHQDDVAGADLLRRARGGDARAFEELARQNERALYRHVLRVVGNADDAEDVVQDAFVSVWRSLASFQGGSFRGWVFRIATNRAIDVIRTRRRRGELPLEPADDERAPSGRSDLEWVEPAAPGPGPLELAGQSEAFSVVEQALEEIPAEQRAALLLRDVEGFAYEEIARITAVEIGTVKSRIHRARVAVRNRLIERGWRSAAG